MIEPEDEGRQQTLLEEICGADKPLGAVLRWYLYHKPLEAISKKDLDTLIGEAEESGDFRLAIDKAIFEGSQSPGERERYVEVLRNLALRAVQAAETVRDGQEKQALTAGTSSLGDRIADYRFMSERTADVLAVASVYYGERLLESEESAGREARQSEWKQSNTEERVAGKREEEERAAKRRERRKLGRGERRAAKRQAKMDEVAARGRRAAREAKRSEAEAEERAIERMEETARDARKEERRGK